MTVKEYRHPVVEYDDLSGLDHLSIEMPAINSDAVERVEWPIKYGYPDNPEDYGAEPDEAFIFIEQEPVQQSPITHEDINAVYPDILEPLVEDKQIRIPDENIPDEGDVIQIGELHATWKRLKGRWRLHRYGYELKDFIRTADGGGV